MRRAVILVAAIVLPATTMVRLGLASSCHSGEGATACESQVATCASPTASEKPACAVCAEPLGPRPVQLRGERPEFFDCIFCALVEVQDRGDVNLSVSSVLSGKPIKLTRTGKAWRASPSTAVALALPSRADECDGSRLVFATANEFTAYVEGHPALDKQKPKAIPLAKVEQIIEAGRPPLPDEAVCPVAKRTIAPDRKTEWTIAKGKVYYFCCAGCKSRFEQ